LFIYAEFAEEELREPSISTMVMNFENKFDPYGAVSAPLYQTATFKQVKILFIFDSMVRKIDFE
jgi:hypothetical protein